MILILFDPTPNKMATLENLTTNCLTYLMSYLDPLSRWYFASCCRKFGRLYQRADIQKLLNLNHKLLVRARRCHLVWNISHPLP